MKTLRRMSADTKVAGGRQRDVRGLTGQSEMPTSALLSADLTAARKIQVDT